MTAAGAGASLAEPDGVLIGGTWSEGEREPLEVTSPADESVVARIAQASPAQGERAVREAAAAQRGWARLSYLERATHLLAIADRLEAGADEAAATITLEMGKPKAQALGEVGFAVAILRYTAEWARRIQGEIVPSDEPGEVIQLLRVPIGVVLAILPWNFPLALFARKAAPALLTGNTVVVKPSELTPMTGLYMARVAEEAGLPAGVLNLTVGDRALGDALVRSPEVGMVTLTGSTRAGKQVMAAAAENLTRVSLELGGKAPSIVWSDSDLELAVESIVGARHLNSGQVCTCAERVFVHDDVYEDFVSAYAARVEQLVVGDPAGEVDLGPIVSSDQLEKIEAAVEDAIDGGATAVVAPARPSGAEFMRGNWITPGVFTDLDQSAKLLREETFGPITPIVRVDSLEQVLALANDSRYALAAYLYSNDFRLITELSQHLECGELYVNRSIGEALQAHHSGHKESGIGGEDGLHGVLKYTQIRSVYQRYRDGV
ncbi:MAG TPA: aldehyde dehydrogenase family protein [Solirubrobacterales bacterium]|nr:aldehyde dehydrogenase family protein [Solirubrobacterales bacterium]